jgi:PleD family two-component response regulator
VNLTASIGAALVRPNESVIDLIHRADQLMYQSKANGRACVTAG